MEWIGLGTIPSTGQDRLDGLLQYFQDTPTRSIDNGIWLAGLIGAAAVASLWLAARWFSTGQRKKNHPWRLFFALCRRHRLTYSERWLLWNLARSQSPDAPARIFLDPDLFRADQLPAGMGTKAEVLDGLRERLFGDLRTPTPKNPLHLPNPQLPADSGNAAGSLGACATWVGFPTAQSPGLDLPPWTVTSSITQALLGSNPIPSAPQGEKSLGG